MRVPDRPGQPVEFRHHEGVAASARSQRFTQAWTVRVSASETMIDIDTISLDPMAAKASRWTVRSCSSVETLA